MKTVKPCPFCGEVPQWEEWPVKIQPGTTLRYFKHSKNLCFCSGFEISPEDVPAWNRRANPWK